MTKFKIEEGKSYRNSRGEKIGPMKPLCPIWVDAKEEAYMFNGVPIILATQFGDNGYLIEEWKEPEEQPPKGYDVYINLDVEWPKSEEDDGA